MSLRIEYFRKLRELIQKIEEGDAVRQIEQAAAVIADAMKKGGCVHLFDTGHMLDSELVSRAGGLVAFQALRIRFEIENTVRQRPELASKDRSTEGLAAYALKSSNALPGDVLVIGSVSGKTKLPVDLSLSARKMGITVIALTSVEYSRMLKSDHSSGLRLFEAADLVIDNGAPPLDAMLEVGGLDAAICPASGIGAAVIMWSVTAQVTEYLLADGLKPSVLKSINFPGSEAFNQEMMSRYAETSL
ncbi:sugar isomerase domain-containing protein [Cohnella caldifontis]|uniref:sugar isomerase domain-containing protein n=1 Tax=Cohnella caldifontis TaxID=3027471 RepID=UPI0023EE0A12|nr:sugar isomerase domain-containing protein [Cohnella sp. YIM B05605]